MPVLHELAHPRWRDATRYSSVLISVGTPTLMPPQPLCLDCESGGPLLQFREQLVRLEAALGRQCAARLDPATRQQPDGGRRGRAGGHDAAAERPFLHRLRERRHLHAACRAIASTTWAETVRADGGSACGRRRDGLGICALERSQTLQKRGGG